MNQIPSEGDCRHCACSSLTAGVGWWCNLYGEALRKTMPGNVVVPVLPICTHDRPRILKAATLDRISYLFECIMCLASEGPEVTKRKDLLETIVREAKEGCRIVKEI